MGDQVFQTNSEELQNMSRWDSTDNPVLQCEALGNSVYTHYVVCSQTFNVMRSQLNARLDIDNAGSDLLVMAIMLTIVVIALIASMTWYIRHLKAKLKNVQQNYTSVIRRVNPKKPSVSINIQHICETNEGLISNEDDITTDVMVSADAGN